MSSSTRAWSCWPRSSRTAARYVPGRLVADLKIARGLDYYTGTVYETELVGYESWGSISSGGRYDSLASDGRTTYPGVGLSIGVTRLLAPLLGQGLLTASRPVPTVVLVAVDSEETREDSIAVAERLRARGIACEVAPKADKFGRQIRYADRRGIPTSGSARPPSGEVKDIRSGDQTAADPAHWSPPDDDLHPQVRSNRATSGHARWARCCGARIATQRLAGNGLARAADVVSLLACVQSQEHAHAFWSLGMRTAGLTYAEVQGEFDAGTFLRTHILRPTWHFVAAADLHWIQAVTAARVQQLNGTIYRQ